MKAGFIQFAPTYNQPQSTLQTLEEIWPAATETNLVVLPELANTGYNFPDPLAAATHAEALNNSRFIEYLSTKAQQHNQYIVSGFNEKAGTQLYNSAILVGPKGLIGNYRKTHLFNNEKDFFSPGNLGFPVFDTPIGRIGMLVCFDWMFPEAWRKLALRHVDIVCHPSNLVLPYAQQAVAVHALINRYFVITANRIGQEGNLNFTGQSVICNPLGQTLTQATPTETIHKQVTLSLESARDKQITPRNHAINDRRIDLY